MDRSSWFEVYNEIFITLPVEYAAINLATEYSTPYYPNYFKGTGIRVNTLSPGCKLVEQHPDCFITYNKFFRQKAC